MKTAEDILQFWFGEFTDDYSYDDSKNKMWFGDGRKFDDTIRSQFGANHEAARKGELNSWTSAPRSLLALVITLDQFSRHIHRETPMGFAQDELAQKLVSKGIAKGIDIKLRPAERVFFYLPLEHAEDRDTQKNSIAAYKKLLTDVNTEHKARFQGYLDYAIAHQKIIDRFGRFPDLNIILGRETTEEEAEFLKQPGSSFL